MNKNGNGIDFYWFCQKIVKRGAILCNVEARHPRRVTKGNICPVREELFSNFTVNRIIAYKF